MLNYRTSFVPSLILLPILLMLSGCGTRFIVARPGDVMILRKPIKNAEVLGPDKDGKLVPGRVNLPEGSGVNTIGAMETEHAK